MNEPDWISAARDELRHQQGADGAWPYRRGARPASEPTVIAALALLAGGLATDRDRVRRACGWIAALQQENGSVGVSAELAGPRWPTALALLLWAAAGQSRGPRERAVGWLLGRRGTTGQQDPSSPIGHDTTLAGWPWVEGTHSWVEPTAAALLALCHAGRGDHARVLEGQRLLRDRAIAGGGWNYGSPLVFGAALRPQLAPTGWALLALAAVRAQATDRGVIERACAYLEASLPQVRACQSLCWGVLGLAAWRRRPELAGQWLAEAHARATAKPDGHLSAAYALLAADDRSLAVLGLRGAAREARDG